MNKLFTISGLILLFLVFRGNTLHAKDASLSNKIYIVFRNDDPSAKSDPEHEKKVMKHFRKHNIPQTFGVIPNIVESCGGNNCRKYHMLSENKDMLDLLQQWQKDGFIEIALHGYTHENNSSGSEIH